MVTFRGALYCDGLFGRAGEGQIDRARCVGKTNLITKCRLPKYNDGSHVTADAFL